MLYDNLEYRFYLSKYYKEIFQPLSKLEDNEKRVTVEPYKLFKYRWSPSSGLHLSCRIPAGNARVRQNRNIYPNRRINMI